MTEVWAKPGTNNGSILYENLDKQFVEMSVYEGEGSVIYL